MDQRICIKCGQVKSLTEFNRNKTVRSGYRSDCKDCQNIYTRNYYKAHVSQILEKQRLYNKTHRATRVQYQKTWRATHKELVQAQKHRYLAKHPPTAEERAKRNARSQAWQKAHYVGRTDPQKARRMDLKVEVFNAYGSHCQCCGITEIQFLCIDHINGGGTKHRRILQSHDIYRWLKKQNYPEGFQILCHNCNQAKNLYKQCPHQSQVATSL